MHIEMLSARCIIKQNSKGKSSSGVSSMDKNEFVSFVVPTYNRGKLVRKTLESICNQEYPKDIYEVIVVDDGSTDNTSKVIEEISREQDVKIRFFRQKNKGPSSARNLGIKKSKGDYICFVDSDIVLDRGVLKELIYQFKKANAGAAGPKTYYAGDLRKIWCAGAYMDFKKGLGVHRGRGEVDRGQYDVLKEVDYMPSSTLLVSRAAIDETGMFDERINYGEDADWCLRAERSGHRIFYVPSTHTYHEVDPDGKLSYFRIYHETRCTFLLMKKNASKKQLFIFYLWFFIFEFPFWVGYSIIYHRDFKMFLSLCNGIKDGILNSQVADFNREVGNDR